MKSITSKSITNESATNEYIYLYLLVIKNLNYQ